MKAIKPAMFPRLWNRLDKYVFSEVHPPFLMAMLIYNGIFFIQTFTKIAGMASEIHLPFSLFLFLFLSHVPEILYITLPISFLFASQAAFSRMSSDSEIIAPLSTGISFWRMNRPILAYGLFLTFFSLILANWLEPNMAQLSDKKYQDFVRSHAIPNLTPGVITTLGKKDVLYVDRKVDQTLLDLIYISHGEDEEKVTFAEEAEFVNEGLSGWTLELKNASIKSFSNNAERSVETINYERLKRDFPNSKVKRTTLFEKPESKMDSLSLFKMMKSNDDKTSRYEVEFFRRIWLSVTCLIFALYAAPLAAKHSRLGSGSSFGVSLFLITLFMFMFQAGEGLASAGTLFPSIAMSLTPLLFLGLGLFLQIGKHRGWSHVTQKWKDHWKTFLFRLKKMFLRFKLKSFFKKIEFKKSKRAAYTARFPTKIDRYITRFFLKTYFLVQLSVITLISLIEYTQISSFVKKNHIDTPMVLKYLAFRIPEVFDMTVFFCLLITVLVVFALMSKNQEITAIRAGGGSLQRLCLPLILIGIFASINSFYMENLVVPWSNRNSFNLRNLIKNKEPSLFTKDVWIKTGKDELLNFKFFDRNTRTLHDSVTYTIDPGALGLKARAKYSQIQFTYKDGWINQVDAPEWLFLVNESGEESMSRQTIQKGDFVPVGLDLSDLEQKKRRPSEFSIPQLREYFHYLQARGYNANQFYTELLAKMAQPFLPFIMMLLAMPMGFQFGRRGSFYSLGLGIMTGLVFWVCFELFKNLGASGTIPPNFAAWSVISVFSIVAIYRFVRMGQ